MTRNEDANLANTDIESLRERIRAGDERAFESLFHSEFAHLCGFATRLTGVPAIAEDIVQDVLLKLWTGRTSLQDVTSLRGYLYRSTRNAAIDYLRHEKVVGNSKAELRAGAEEFASDIEAEMLQVERARSLQEAISLLSPASREVVILRWMRGMKHSEIAETLGISSKGVEMRITRALAAMRVHLAPERAHD